jgi:hypothetical protein
VIKIKYLSIEMPNPWITALKKWNEGKETWCLPKKGSKAYDEVRALMPEKKLKASAEPEKAPAPAPAMPAPSKSKGPRIAPKKPIRGDVEPPAPPAPSKSKGPRIAPKKPIRGDVEPPAPPAPPMKIPMEPQRKAFSDKDAPKVKFVEPQTPLQKEQQRRKEELKKPVPEPPMIPEQYRKKILDDLSGYDVSEYDIYGYGINYNDNSTLTRNLHSEIYSDRTKEPVRKYYIDLRKWLDSITHRVGKNNNDTIILWRDWETIWKAPSAVAKKELVKLSKEGEAIQSFGHFIWKWFNSDDTKRLKKNYKGTSRGMFPTYAMDLVDIGDTYYSYWDEWNPIIGLAIPGVNGKALATCQTDGTISFTKIMLEGQASRKGIDEVIVNEYREYGTGDLESRYKKIERALTTMKIINRGKKSQGEPEKPSKKEVEDFVKSEIDRLGLKKK